MRFILFLLLLIPIIASSQSSDLVRVTQAGNQLYISLNSTVTVIPSGSGSRVTYTNTNTFDIVEPLSYIRDTSCNLFVYGNIGTGSEILINKKWIDRVIKGSNNKASVIMYNGARYDLLQSYASMSSQLLEASGCGGSGGGDGLWTDHGDGISPSDLSHAVGIWNVNPIAPLDVTGSETMGIRIRNTSEIGVMEFGFDNGGGKLILRDESGVSVIQLTNNGASFIDGGTLRLGDYDADGNNRADSLGLTEQDYVLGLSTNGTIIQVHKDSLGGADFSTVPLAEEILAADELVGKDSSITWQDVTDQMRDSILVDSIISNVNITASTITGLIKNRKDITLFVTLPNPGTADRSIALPAVSTLTGQEGIKIKVSVRDLSPLYDYYVLPNVSTELIISDDRYASRYYFDPDETAVFVLSRNLSGLVWKLENTTSDALQFGRPVDLNLTYSADIASKRFIRGGTVRTNLGAEYFIQNVPVSAYNSNNPDSVFVYQVKDKAPWGRNIATGSDQLHNQTYWVRPGADIQVLTDFTPGPDGSQTAERLVRDGDNELWSALGNTTAGDKFRVSFWAKQGIAASNDNVTLSLSLPIDATAPVNVTGISKAWERYSVTLTADANTVNERVSIIMNGDDFDSLDITNVLIETGEITSDYKRTETTASVEGTLYAVYKSNSGNIEADKVFQRKDDYLHLQQALNYAITQKQKIVYCERNRTIKGKIDVPIGSGILGTYPGGALGNDYTSQGTIFYLDLRNASTNAFEFPATGNYEAGQFIEGIMMIPISAGRAAIKTNDGFYNTIKNVSIVNYVNSTRHLSYGIEITAGSIQTQLNGVQIRQASIAGILYDGSTQMSLINSKIMDCEVGMISAGDMYLENTWFEDLDSCSIIHDGATTRITMIPPYTEGVPSAGGGGTAPVFYIKSANTFTVIGGLINGEGNDNTLVDLENVKSTTFIGSRFVNGTKAFETTSATGKITLVGCTSDIPIPPNSYEGIYDSMQVVLINSNESSANEDYNNVIPRLETWDGEVHVSQLDSCYANDLSLYQELKLNSPTITNLNENIVKHSERVESGVGDWSNLSSVTFTQNDTLAPDGATTAERVTFGSGLGEWRYTPTAVPLVVGQWYTISFYVANSSFDEIMVELGDVSAEAQTVTLTNSDTWVRHSVSMKHTAGASIIDFITNGSAGQYCHFWGVKVSRNLYGGDYIQTTGTVKTADMVNAQINIPDGDVLEFDGDVAIQGALIDSTGSAGTAGQVPQPEGTAWVWDDLTVSDIVGLGDSLDLIWTKSAGKIYPTTATDDVGVLSAASNGTIFNSPANGVLQLSNFAGTDFGRLQFGGTTSSFPSLKRSTTILQSRLADDSDYAPFSAQIIRTDHSYQNVNTGLPLDIRNGNGTAMNVYRFSNLVNSTHTSGTTNNISTSVSFVPSGAGSGSFRTLYLPYTLNGTAGAQSGTATGILLDATETSLNGLTHNLMDLQVASASKLKVTNAGAATFAGDVTVPDEAYGSGWENSLEVPTKNALWDLLETKPLFGQMNFEDSTYVINPSGVTPITNDNNTLFTVVGDEGAIVVGGDSCIISYDGLTSITFSLSLSSAGGVYKIGFSIDGTPVNNLGAHVTLTGGTETVPLNYTFDANGSPTPQVIKPTIIQVSGADPTLVDGSFTVYRILH